MSQDDILKTISAQFPKSQTEETSGAMVIAKEAILEFSHFLKNGPLAFDTLSCLTAVDRKDVIEIVYILDSSKNKIEITVKIKLFVSAPLEVESVSSLWKSADWFEREVYDLFGVRFLNHSNLKRILNPDDWKGYPLRKDYSDPNLITKPKF